MSGTPFRVYFLKGDDMTRRVQIAAMTVFTAAAIALPAARGATRAEREAEVRRGYSGYWDKVKMDGGYLTRTTAFARANQLAYSLALTNPKFANRIKRGTLSYQETWRTPFGKKKVTRWLAYAKYKGSSPFPPTHRVWRHSRGSFVKTRGNRWVETNPQNKKLYFVEIGRNRNGVTLYDASRRLKVFLGRGNCYWSTRGRWHLLYRGNWSR